MLIFCFKLSFLCIVWWIYFMCLFSGWLFLVVVFFFLKIFILLCCKTLSYWNFGISLLPAFSLKEFSDFPIFSGPHNSTHNLSYTHEKYLLNVLLLRFTSTNTEVKEHVPCVIVTITQYKLSNISSGHSKRILPFLGHFLFHKINYRF